MRPIILSLRRILPLCLAAVAILAGLWYWGFHLPLEADLARIQAQSLQAEDDLSAAAARLCQMEAMEQALLDVASANDARPQVAPFDNKQAVLQELNRVLRSSLDYSLQFHDPTIAQDGTVRRVVVMQIHCRDLDHAQTILSQLESSPFLCLIQNLSLTGSGNILDGPVQLQTTVTYLESTKLK